MAKTPETKTERDERLELEQINAELARAIAPCMPPGTGFALMMFTFGERGSFAWCSNANRQDMLRMLKEAHEKLSHSA